MNETRIIALSLLALVGGCSSSSAERAPSRVEAKPTRVETLVVGEQAVPKTLLLAGTLAANQESDLAANASGRVLRTFVERGTPVKRGEPVVQLDTRVAALSASEAESSVEAARLQLKHAEDDCARYLSLYKRGVIAKAEYDRQSTNCKTAVTSAAAAAARAGIVKQTLRDGTVRALFSGLVVERYVSVGEFVQPSTRVARIVDIDPLRLVLTLPEQHLGAVFEGQHVEFRVAAYPKRSFGGTVRYIAPAIRSTTRDLVFEAIVPNPEKLLRPGLFASARLEIGTEKLPVLPRAALKQEGDTTRVFAVVDGHVEERIVQLGPSEGERVSVRKGVAAGDRVVARPDDRIGDGLAVE